MKFEHSSPAVSYSDPILAKIGLDSCRDIEVENPILLREIKNVEEVIFSKKPNSDKLKRINIKVYTAICSICKGEVRNIIKEDI